MAVRRISDSANRRLQNAQQSAFGGSIGGTLRSARPVDRVPPNRLIPSAGNLKGKGGNIYVYSTWSGQTEAPPLPKDVPPGSVYVAMGGLPIYRMGNDKWSYLLSDPDQAIPGSMYIDESPYIGRVSVMGFGNTIEPYPEDFSNGLVLIGPDNHIYTDVGGASIFGQGNELGTPEDDGYHFFESIIGDYNRVHGGQIMTTVGYHNTVINGGYSAVFGYTNETRGVAYSSVVGWGNYAIYGDDFSPGELGNVSYLSIFGVSNDAMGDFTYSSMHGYNNWSGEIHGRVSYTAIMGNENSVRDVGEFESSEFNILFGQSNNVYGETWHTSLVGNGNSVYSSQFVNAFGYYNTVESPNYPGFNSAFGSLLSLEGSSTLLFNTAVGFDSDIYDSEHSILVGTLSYLTGNRSFLAGYESNISGDDSSLLGSRLAVSADQSWILGANVHLPTDWTPDGWSSPITASPLATDEYGVLAARKVEIQRSLYSPGSSGPNTDLSTYIVLAHTDGSKHEIGVDGEGLTLDGVPFEAGSGVPDGGTAGQSLIKNSATDGDASWGDPDGLSAYEVAQSNGFTGTESEWLASLVGPSAYEEAVSEGFIGTESEWLESLKGASAYDLAVLGGFSGTEAEWIESLKGDSAYKVAQDNGFAGTESDWLDSLVGPQGDTGPAGTLSTSTGALSFSETSLASGASATGSVASPEIFSLLKLTSTAPARLTLYLSAAQRDADAGRPAGTRPTGNHGVVYEVVTSSGMLEVDATPAVFVFGGSGTLYYRITNVAAISSDIDIDIDYVSMV